MIKQKSQILCAWFLVWDLGMTALAWVWAYTLRFESRWLPLDKDPPSFALCFESLPLVLLLSALAYRLTGQYRIGRFRRLREELLSILRGTALMGLFVAAATFGLQNPYESRGAFLLFFLLTVALMLAARRASWMAIHWLRSRGFNQTQAIIVGTGRVARRTARSLRLTRWLGIKNVGFVEDQPTRWCSDLDILGTVADLPRLVEKYHIS